MSAPQTKAPPLWSRELVLATLLNLLMFMGFQMLPAGIPMYLKGLGADDLTLGLAAGLATAGTLLARPFAGTMLDRLGRGGVFRAGLLLLCLFTLGFYFFPIAAAILLLRFLHGLGWGVANTACNTIAADCMPRERFGEGMGYYGLSASLAMAVAPAVALALPPGPMLLASAAFTALTLFLACFMPYRALPARSLASGPRLPFYEKKAVLPGLYMLLSNLAYGAVVTFVPVYAAQRGIQANMGLFFSVCALAMLITRPWAGKYMDKKGAAAVTLPGLCFCALALLLLSQAESFTAFLLAAACFGLGQSGAMTGAQTLAVRQASPERRGAATATFFMGFDLGLGLGAVLAGRLSIAAGYGAMFFVFSLAPLLGAVLFILTRRSKAVF